MTLKAELRCVQMVNWELCAMMVGAVLMLKLSVDSSTSQQQVTSHNRFECMHLCNVLCFPNSGLVAYSGGTYGQGIGPINLDDVACSGTETTLVACSYDRNTADCTHADDAGVRCHSRK